MFSGITKGIFRVVAVERSLHLTNYSINLSIELCKNLSIGESVAVDGVCQSVINIADNIVSFQAIGETLNKTTLNDLYVGRYVSIERSLCVGDEIGGHEVSGHIYGTGIIDDIGTNWISDISNLNNHQPINHTLQNKDGTENNILHLRIKCNPEWIKYILPKGFIAIDGSSLTIGNTNPQLGIFDLHLIPETLRNTNFGNKKIGDKVNIEFDTKTQTIVDTVERLLPAVIKALNKD